MIREGRRAGSEERDAPGLDLPWRCRSNRADRSLGLPNPAPVTVNNVVALLSKYVGMRTLSTPSN
jgi:hypothetical protein